MLSEKKADELPGEETRKFESKKKHLPKHKPGIHEKSLNFFAVTNFPFLIGIVLTLLSDGECGVPLRTWLKVLSILFIAYIIIFALMNSSGLISDVPNVSKKINICLLVVHFVWYIIGFIWIHSEENNCYANWYYGHLMSKIMIFWFYIQFVLATLLFCCLTFMLSSGLGMVRSKEKCS